MTILHLEEAMKEGLFIALEVEEYVNLEDGEEAAEDGRAAVGGGFFHPALPVFPFAMSCRMMDSLRSPHSNSTIELALKDLGLSLGCEHSRSSGAVMFLWGWIGSSRGRSGYSAISLGQHVLGLSLWWMLATLRGYLDEHDLCPCLSFLARLR